MKINKPSLNLNSLFEHEALKDLNEKFRPLSPVERIRLLYDLFEQESVLFTSSFGTKSALLLYWISNIVPSQKIYFLDTGYHFEETLAYKNKLIKAFALEVVNIYPDPIEHQKTLEQELWSKNTSRCCTVNKVLPLELVKLEHEVWVSGLMAYQTPFRKNLDIFEVKDNILKFSPLIDLTAAEFYKYYQQAALPVHPLEVLGYHSIGCLHCTKRGIGRSGRWSDSSKTECGLHFN